MTTTCWWWPSTFTWRESASHNTQDSSLTSKSWKIPMYGIGGRFAPLTIMSNEDTDIDSMITTFNTAVTETTSEILGNHRQKKKPLDHCRHSWSVRQKERTEKEKIWLEPEGSEKYKEVNNNREQCSEIEENIRKNNSKRAYQLVKDLTTVKQGKVTTVQDHSGSQKSSRY